MGRKIKFPLIMADGVKVRTNIEDLRQHADYKHLMECFLNGKLEEWLKDREYIDLANRIGALDKDNKDSYVRMCEILNIECINKTPIDIENVERLNYKRNILRQITSDSEIINNAGIVAFAQTELEELLKKQCKLIYLYREHDEDFIIPKIEGVEYVGIGNTQARGDSEVFLCIKNETIKIKNIVLLKSDTGISIDADDVNINSEENDDIVYKDKDDFLTYIGNKYSVEEAKAERDFLDNNFQNLISIFINLSESGLERANWFIVQILMMEVGDLAINKRLFDKYSKKCENCSDILARAQSVYLYEDTEHTFVKKCDEIIDELKRLADRGDPFACTEMYRLSLRKYYKISIYDGEKYAEKAIEMGNSQVYEIMGMVAYEKKDFGKAFNCFRESAVKNYVLGYLRMGEMYEKGLGCRKDYIVALDYYITAIGLGSSYGALYAGQLYFYKCDYDKAFPYFEKSAGNGNVEAMYYLGVCYENGLGVDANIFKYDYWYRRAANWGHSEAIKAIHGEKHREKIKKYTFGPITFRWN